MAVMGHRQPRICTAPLRELTHETSAGFALIEFAKSIGCPLLPWQEEASIRALELLPNRTYRFKTVLILVGRQSGKTTLLKVWALWRLYADSAKLVLGAAQALDISREAWQGSVDIAQDSKLLKPQVSKVRYANGEQCLTLKSGARYRICATTRGAGRGLAVDMLILDELREQRDWDSWSALSKTIIARPRGQIVCITNQGDGESVVLNSLREAALAERSTTLGLFEWSAPDGCELDDPEMWAYACPGLGHTIDEESIRAALATDPPERFRTEILCQYVTSMSTALDGTGWAAGADPGGSVAPYRGKLAAGIDVAMDGHHVALVVAASIGGGRYRTEPIASWSDTADARLELPALLASLAPTTLAWFPSGPASALATYLRTLPYAVEMTGADVTTACMALADLVRAGKVLHNANPLVDGQAATAGKLNQGDGFRFTRRGAGNCNALYAIAGAIHHAQIAAATPDRPPVWVL